MLGTFLTPCIVPKWVEIRVTLILCLFGLGIGTLFLGPFYTDESLPAMLAGLTITGLFMGPMIILNMGEMMHATHLAYPHCDHDHSKSLLSGMLNCCFGLGFIFGPSAGSLLYTTTSFTVENNVIGLFIIFMGLLYIVCASGC